MVAATLGGHDQRHTVPSVGLAASLPTHLCERLGYWRSVRPAGDDPGALHRAVLAARERAKPGSQFMSNRYATADADPVASDVARYTCVRLAAEAHDEKWTNYPAPLEGEWPTADQARAISELVHRRSGSVAGTGDPH